MNSGIVIGAQDGGIYPPSSMGYSSPSEKSPHDGTIPLVGLDREKLKAAMTERGTTPRAVSRAIGDNPYLVRDILSGKSKNPRSDTLSKIAEHLKIDVSQILTGDSVAVSSDARDRQIVPMYLAVRYRVQAGLWYENDSEEPIEQLSYGVVPDPRYAEWPQWLELVTGDSADRKVDPGSYVHVVDAIAMGYAPKHGNWVVVERRRDQGAVRERTVKQVEISASGEVLLWPRSTNPKWSEPVSLTDGARSSEDIEAEIVGKVIGSYDPDF